jgi:hypothetical protein
VAEKRKDRGFPDSMATTVEYGFALILNIVPWQIEWDFLKVRGMGYQRLIQQRPLSSMDCLGQAI